MTKSEFASHAGISPRTLARRCQHHREALTQLGCHPRDQRLSSLALIYLCSQYNTPRPPCIANTSLQIPNLTNTEK